MPKSSPDDAADPAVLFLDQTGQLGGAELCLAEIAASLRDHSTVVLLQDGPFRQRLEERQVRTIIMPLAAGAQGIGKQSRATAVIRAAPSLARLVFDLARLAARHHLIYANTPKAILAGAAASLLSGRPLVVHLHDILDRTHFSALNIFLLRTAARRARLIIANSQATAAAFGPGVRPRVEIVPNGFDPAPFDAVTAADLRRLREELELPRAFTLGVFGRLTSWKGQHVVLDALALLPGVHCLVVGDALFTEADKSYAAALHRQAAALGLSDRVHFLGFRPDVPRLMRGVDAVVHSSVQPEPFGRVIVEAMLAGRPVIAANAGGAAEILADGVTGLLVPPGDPAALARAVLRLIADPALAAHLARNARTEAEHRYALPPILAKIRGLLLACQHPSAQRPNRAGAAARHPKSWTR